METVTDRNFFANPFRALTIGWLLVRIGGQHRCDEHTSAYCIFRSVTRTPNVTLALDDISHSRMARYRLSADTLQPHPTHWGGSTRVGRDVALLDAGDSVRVTASGICDVPRRLRLDTFVDDWVTVPALVVGYPQCRDCHRAPSASSWSWPRSIILFR